LASPEGYDPDPALLDAARNEAPVELFRDPREAAAGARVVTTDVWASMGQEDETAQRAAAFAGYCIDTDTMARAAPDAIFLHCLPAHRGEEVTPGVIDGPASRVWDEAENRLHAQKALLVLLMGSGE
jgi:ornithine carbamoyltransferase